MLQPDGFMIVIGASAGGMNAIRQVLADIDKGINAAIAVVIHISKPGASEHLVARLQQSTVLPCHVAADNMPLEKGHVYLAAAGLHLVVKENKLLLGRGPVEGRWRPSIDVTFRSAAVAWDTHCIGVILTGMLDDGVAGMEAIKKCGGLSVLQDPEEAEYSSMPLAVLENMEVDKVLRLNEIGKSLGAFAGMSIGRADVPELVAKEASLAELVASRIDHMMEPGMQQSPLTCPDCGGALWEIQDGNMTRWRCHIGHSYTENVLLSRQVSGIEDTLWIALRMMEQRRMLLSRIAGREEEAGLRTLSADHYTQMREIELHIERLKELLFAHQRTASN